MGDADFELSLDALLPQLSDVLPLYHSSEECEAVKIAYSHDFEQIFAYFRAILEANEKTARAFDITTLALRSNPANYSVWQYRRVLLKELNKDLTEEIRMLNAVMEENPKNYQVWHHRKSVVQQTGNAAGELDFISRILREDSKNYHAWQHRHWVVEHFKLWGDELSYSEKMLDDDIRNNSAWNYRYFVISNTSGWTEAVVSREITSSVALLRKVPLNESAWNYVTGILLNNSFAAGEAVFRLCEELDGNPEMEKKQNTIRFALAFMVDYLDDQVSCGEKDKEKMQRIGALCDRLTLCDPIRKNYWTFLKTFLQSKYDAK